ncbi:MAG: hypothetical protein F4Y82_04635 [Cenarchaeum sp. SB0665_bin_23]|nr:hypothetical protein [Cenarchaeum sp. SB0667_bin_13]MXY61382.1 hypothetical protein [Cenarchaeum sp. SB0665_bin_23]MXZ94245.1 hypothetical protein [Cenarchaeum sp. SB0666_bin_15]MYB47152.1 hypothetical protein [Cenarchaeum sp. SB0662_bin_33]MYC79459.1 hypothetical protein [Cenarchaeum sp. SB0661_bin_35]MYD58689.1 hypothetical protein [Cenarchaeum sp. SB0678_bin_8]MYG32896.1 hypothetical protein [Cenarchaeum sp. SB0677_bin_16]MYI51674.1 hypothetical protein [Cenarchaeum sp. SB0673_bin_9]M
MYDRYYGWDSRRRDPRVVKGGIKPNSKRGNVGHSKLAKAWMAILAYVDPEGEFTRGKSYARKGQVLSVSVEPGLISGIVQGSGTRPYQSNISLTLTDTDYHRKLINILSKHPALVASLLAGEFPENIGKVLSNERFTLFPNGMSMSTSCGCVRWTALCRHILAVSYILAEELDRNPFLLLRLFGVEKEDLLNAMESRVEWIRDERPASINTDTQSTETDPEHNSPNSLHAITSDISLKADQGSEGHTYDEPPFVMGGLYPSKTDDDAADDTYTLTTLPKDPAVFWGRSDHMKQPHSEPISSEDATLRKQLGNFPMWRGDERFVEVMDKIYRQASANGIDIQQGIRKTTGSKRGRPPKSKKE